MFKLFPLTFVIVWSGLSATEGVQFTTSSTSQPDTAENQTSNLHYNIRPVTWQQATSSCTQDEGGSLLPVTTQTDPSRISDLRQRFRPDDVWVGDYMVYNETFTPTDGGLLNQTDKCVGLTITSIKMATRGHVIQYELTIQPACEGRLGALCVCQSGSDSMTLRVQSRQHSWSYYRTNRCGLNCRLWTPPYDTRFPETFGTVVGEGNVTLGGAPTYLAVGLTYWINVVARLVEKPAAGTGGIIECGYISQFVDHVMFGPCNEERAFICDGSTGDRNVMTTVASMNSTVSTSGGQDYTNMHLQTSSGVSVSEYAGFVTGGIICVAVCVLLVVVWKKCHHNSVSSKDGVQPKGGRSFMRQKPDTGQFGNDEHESKDDNRITMYAKIDPSRVRNTLTRAPDNTNQQPDIILTTNPSGYLPMDGFADSTDRDMYDVIGNHGNSEDNASKSNVYSVSIETEAESVYNTTLDRHPSRRALITDSAYDHLDFSMSVSASMDGNVCNSVNMEDGNYTNLRPTRLQNPTYDRVVIQ